MGEWRESEWRIPRKGEVVIDSDGNLGIVTKSLGTLAKRSLWVDNINGTEIHTDIDSTFFKRVDTPDLIKFQHERFNLMGYKIGSLCSFKSDLNVPLEILQMDWNVLRYSMSFCLRDLRNFDGEIMITEDELIIPLFDLNMPLVENIFSKEDSGLKYRLEINLIETSNDGWTVTGSPWEFNEKEDALKEVEIWKARLRLRRIASVLNADWKITFPAWTIEAIEKDDKIYTRVKEIEAYNGSNSYFKTALHAATALKMISSQDWLNLGLLSQDYLNL